MNKSTVFLCGILGTASTALAQGPVYSVNIVGIQKVTTPPGEYVQASNPFVKSATDLNSVVGNQMTGGTDFDTGDNVLVWTGTTYKTFFLVNSGGEYPELDGKWISLDGEGNPVVATEPLPTGKGFWFKNNNAEATVSFVGDVESAATKSMAIVPGFNLVSYPYSSSVALNSAAMNLNLAAGCIGGEEVDTSDTISIWGEGTYRTYFLVNFPAEPTLHNKWCYVGGDGGVYAADVVLEPGMSFWYGRRSNAGSFTWTTTKPY